jgi:hypothetical protein
VREVVDWMGGDFCDFDVLRFLSPLVFVVYELFMIYVFANINTTYSLA